MLYILFFLAFDDLKTLPRMFQKTFKNLTFCPKKAPDGLQNQLVSLILEKYGKYHIESVSRLLNKKYFPYLFPCRGPVMLHFCSK